MGEEGTGAATPPGNNVNKPSSNLAAWLTFAGAIFGGIVTIVVAIINVNKPGAPEKPTAQPSPTAIAATAPTVNVTKEAATGTPNATPTVTPALTASSPPAPTPKPQLAVFGLQALWKPILFDAENSYLVKSYVPNSHRYSELMTALIDNERIWKGIQSFENEVSQYDIVGGDPPVSDGGAALIQWLEKVRYNFDKIQVHLRRVKSPDDPVLTLRRVLTLDISRQTDLQVAENMRVEVLKYLTEITKELQMPVPGFADTHASSVAEATKEFQRQ